MPWLGHGPAYVRLYTTFQNKLLSTSSEEWRSLPRKEGNICALVDERNPRDNRSLVEIEHIPSSMEMIFPRDAQRECVNIARCSLLSLLPRLVTQSACKPSLLVSSAIKPFPLAATQAATPANIERFSRTSRDIVRCICAHGAHGWTGGDERERVRVSWPRRLQAMHTRNVPLPHAPVQFCLDLLLHEWSKEEDDYRQ